MSDNVIKEALNLIPKKDLEDFFEDNFQRILLMQLDSGTLSPEVFKYQREQTTKIKNILLTYREK